MTHASFFVIPEVNLRFAFGFAFLSVIPAGDLLLSPGVHP